MRMLKSLLLVGIALGVMVACVTSDPTPMVTLAIIPPLIMIGLEQGLPWLAQLLGTLIQSAIQNGQHTQAQTALLGVASFASQIANHVAGDVATAAATGNSDAVRTAAIHGVLAAVATPGGGQGAPISPPAATGTQA